jgi:hypothetical protein
MPIYIDHLGAMMHKSNNYLERCYLEFDQNNSGSYFSKLLFRINQKYPINGKYSHVYNYCKALYQERAGGKRPWIKINGKKW